MSEKLWEAIDSNSYDEVEDAILNGADINYVRNFNTPVTEAVQNDCMDIVQYLVSTGADLSKFGLRGEPPLHCATKVSLEYVKYLLSQEADINATDWLGQTALTIAVGFGKTDIVDYLLNNGADINKFGKGRSTPLSKACSNKNFNLVEKLLLRGADINCCSGDGNTPLAKAIAANHIEIVKYLLSNRGVDVNLFQAEKDRSMPPLSWACKGDSLEIVKLLIRLGANVNQFDSRGSTALMRAVEHQNIKVAEYLLTQEADVCKMIDKGQGRTALSAAVRNCDLPTVVWLLKNGAKISIPQAFLTAIACGNFEIVKYLHKEGASINVKHRNGDLPLKESIEKGQVKICKYLINKGADVSVLEENYKVLRIMKYLLSNNIQMAKLIMQMNTNLNLTLKSGYTILNKFVEMESYSKVKLLVEQGADVNKIDDNKKSALAIAASIYSVRIVTFLIDSGADINLAIYELIKFAENNSDFFIYLATVIHKKKSEFSKPDGSGQEEAQ